MVMTYSKNSLVKKLTRRSTLVLILLTTTLPAWAELNATVDRNVLSEDEILVYNLRSDGMNINGSPDFSPLEKDFEILGTSRSNQIQIINGRNASWAEWNLTLTPRRTGSLTLPPVNHDGFASNAITVEIRKASDAAQNGADGAPVFMENSLSADTLWEGQEAVMTLEVVSRANFAENPDLSPPKADGLIFKLIENDQRSEKIVNGIRYQIIALKYLVTPTRAGQLTIPGQTLTGAIVESDPYTRNSLFGMQRTRPLRTRAQELSLMVNPPPTDWPADKPWLPAEQLSISEIWSGSPNELKTGDSITRTVTITAQGANSAQIPPLPTLNILGINHYPDQPRIENEVTDSGSNGIRSESIALVPTQPGTVTLPATQVTWFNVTSQTIETATLAAQTLTIAPGNLSQTVPQTPSLGESQTTSQSTQLPVASTDTIDTEQGGQQNAVIVDDSSLILWQTTTGVFSLLWLSTLAYLFRTRQTIQGAEADSPLQTVSGSTGEKALFQKLEATCRENRLTEVEQDILSWGQTLMNNDTLSASDIIASLDSKTLKKEWYILLHSRYGAAKSTVDCSHLIQLLIKARKRWLHLAKKESHNGLSINPA